jgi:hypothetical protein
VQRAINARLHLPLNTCRSGRPPDPADMPERLAAPIFGWPVEASFFSALINLALVGSTRAELTWAR